MYDNQQVFLEELRLEFRLGKLLVQYFLAKFILVSHAIFLNSGPSTSKIYHIGPYWKKVHLVVLEENDFEYRE